MEDQSQTSQIAQPIQPAVNTAPSVQPVVISISENQVKYASLLIRLGLIFVFLWAAVFMSLSPDKFIHYLPVWVDAIISRTIALHIFAVFEVMLSIWLAVGKKTFYSGMVAALTIAALTLTNYQEFETLFRNVSIFFSALALVVISKK